MPTTWTKPNAAATPWGVLDDSFPPILNGGEAATLVWLDTLKGGAAAPALSNIVRGVMPQHTTWAARGAP